MSKKMQPIPDEVTYEIWRTDGGEHHQIALRFPSVGAAVDWAEDFVRHGEYAVVRATTIRKEIVSHDLP